MNLRKKVLNFIGICDKCGANVEFNQVHSMKGQFKDSKEYFICTNCKTKEAIDKLKNEDTKKIQSESI